jgi:RNA polymerase sigma-70 factor (ECF subfamily)
MNRPRSASEPQDVDLALGRAWREHRRHLLDIGFRMLGNVAEAEDVVQEAFARLVRADIDEIDDVGGWLVIVVSRLCLDRLRAGRRHPTSPEATLGDRPTERTPDPAERVTLDDNVNIAMHLVLERLTAAERTAFVLHDVFQYPFEAIAEIVGRTPAACRQLASRARRTIRDGAGPARFVVEPTEQRRLTERFIAACANGDIDELLEVLDPDVSGEGDAGGRVGVRRLVGRANIATGILQYLGPQSHTTVLSLPAAGDAAVVAFRDDRVVAVVVLTIEGAHITHIHAVADPIKLAPLSAVLAPQPPASPA